jgi:membrane protease YdiL (CAAX protease family)
MKNIVIFVIGVTVIAWGGGILGSVLAADNPAMSSVGVSIAAMGPLLMAIVLRRWGKLGWSDAGLRLRFGQSKGWYALGLLYAPLVIVLIVGLALLFGTGQWNPDRPAAVRAMFTTFGIVLLPMLFLAVGEEFGWRGFLEPALWSVNRRLVLNHVFVGLVWGFWHFPILLFAPGSETSLGQLLMVVIGCVALAIVYGQMRLWSDSIWPCVILHGVSNAVMISVASSELLLFDESAKNIISFNTTSVAVTGIWVITAALILARLGKESPARLAPVGDRQR